MHSEQIHHGVAEFSKDAFINTPTVKDLEHYYGTNVSPSEYIEYQKSLELRAALITEQIKYLASIVANAEAQSAHLVEAHRRSMEQPGSDSGLAKVFLEDVARSKELLLKTQQDLAGALHQKDLFAMSGDKMLIERQLDVLFDDITALKASMVKFMMLGYKQAYVAANDRRPAMGMWQTGDGVDDLRTSYARETLKPQALEQHLLPLLGEIPEGMHTKSIFFSSGMAAVNTALEIAQREIMTNDKKLAFPSTGLLYYETTERVRAIFAHTYTRIDYCDFGNPADLDRLSKTKPAVVYCDKNSSSQAMQSIDLVSVIKALPQTTLFIVDYSLVAPGTDFSEVYKILPPFSRLIMLTSLQKLFQLGDDTEQGGMATVISKNKAHTDATGRLLDEKSSASGTKMKPHQIAHWSLAQPEAIRDYGKMITDNVARVGSQLDAWRETDFPQAIKGVYWCKDKDSKTDATVLMVRFDFCNLPHFKKPKDVGDATANKTSFDVFRKMWKSLIEKHQPPLHIIFSGDSYGFRHFRVSSLDSTIPGERSQTRSLRIAPGINNPVEVRMILETFKQALAEFYSQCDTYTKMEIKSHELSLAQEGIDESKVLELRSELGKWYRKRARELSEELEQTPTLDVDSRTMELGEYIKKAKEQFVFLIEAKPDDAAPHYELGRTNLIAGESSEAIKNFERAIELDEKEPFPLDHYYLAQALEKQIALTPDREWQRSATARAIIQYELFISLAKAEIKKEVEKEMSNRLSYNQQGVQDDADSIEDRLEKKYVQYQMARDRLADLKL